MLRQLFRLGEDWCHEGCIQFAFLAWEQKFRACLLVALLKLGRTLVLLGAKEMTTGSKSSDQRGQDVAHSCLLLGKIASLAEITFDDFKGWNK